MKVFYTKEIWKTPEFQSTETKIKYHINLRHKIITIFLSHSLIHCMVIDRCNFYVSAHSDFRLIP